MLLFIAAFATYLRMELPGVYRDNGMLGMFTLLTLAVLGMMALLVRRKVALGGCRSAHRFG